MLWPDSPRTRLVETSRTWGSELIPLLIPIPLGAVTGLGGGTEMSATLAHGEFVVSAALADLARMLSSALRPVM